MLHPLTDHQKQVVMEARLTVLVAIFHQNLDFLRDSIETLIVAEISLEYIEPMVQESLDIIADWKAKTGVRWEDDRFIKVTWLNSALEAAEKQIVNKLKEFE